MILVTGGTGHLGTVLVRNLVDRGEAVRVLARDTAAARARLPEEVEVVAGDVRDRSTLESATRRVDCVVAAATGFGPGRAGSLAIDQRANIELLRTAQRAGVPRFVLLSMSGAGADRRMSLLRHKFEAEQAVRRSGLDWRIVRPTVFAELWLELVGGPLARGGTATVFGRGDNPINFVSVNDVASTVERAALDPRLREVTVEIGGPQDATLNEMVELVARLTGRAPRARHVPVPLLRVASVGLMRLRPDVGGLAEAAIAMASERMTLDEPPSADVERCVGGASLEDVARGVFPGTARVS